MICLVRLGCSELGSVKLGNAKIVRLSWTCFVMLCFNTLTRSCYSWISTYRYMPFCVHWYHSMRLASSYHEADCSSGSFSGPVTVELWEVELGSLPLFFTWSSKPDSAQTKDLYLKTSIWSLYFSSVFIPFNVKLLFMNIILQWFYLKKICLI